jgi:DNA-binding CsgD family transcriptional regulator
MVDGEPWRRAIGAWGADIDPFEAAYARYRFAETELRRSGVRADVSTELVAAWRTAVGLGAAALQRAIEVLARRARVPLAADAATRTPEAGHPGRPGASGPIEPVATGPGRSGSTGRAGPHHGLSAREIEVLRLVAAGRSNGEIGDELFITRKTAGVHVTHILDKLGVSNRVEAAMAAARLGLLEAEGEGEPEREPEPRVG